MSKGARQLGELGFGSTAIHTTDMVSLQRIDEALGQAAAQTPERPHGDAGFATDDDHKRVITSEMSCLHRLPSLARKGPRHPVWD
jgi:hypothetical protein